MTRTLFTCACGSSEHILIVTQDEEYFGIEVLLSPHGLWKRIRYAVRYVLGKRSNYGAFEEILLDKSSCNRLGKLLLEASHE